MSEQAYHPPVTTLTISVSDPEDQYKIKQALRAGAVESAIDDFQRELRSIVKYEELSSDVHAMAARIQDLWFSTVGEVIRDE